MSPTQRGQVGTGRGQRMSAQGNRDAHQSSNCRSAFGARWGNHWSCRVVGSRHLPATLPESAAANSARDIKAGDRLRRLHHERFVSSAEGLRYRRIQTQRRGTAPNRPIKPDETLCSPHDNRHRRRRDQTNNQDLAAAEPRSQKTHNGGSVQKSRFRSASAIQPGL